MKNKDCFRSHFRKTWINKRLMTYVNTDTTGRLKRIDLILKTIQHMSKNLHTTKNKNNWHCNNVNNLFTNIDRILNI